ncbi:hypothetical protein F4810DRAFT_372432 [Camillea tinctor]|nr:hypothetical protein F4810DRAFT_372432 [Camillea tinctor]
MNAAAPSFKPAGELHSLYPHPHPRNLNDPRSEIPCKFFQAGYCRNGATCPFLHLKDSANLASQEPQAEEIPGLAPIEDTFAAYISNALVHFEAGAAITRVLLASDFSTVQVRQLPKDSTPESVLAVLRSHGLNTSKVRQIQITRHEHLSIATITAEDPAFADLATAKLSSQTALRRGSAPRPFAASINTPLVSDLGALSIDRKKVQCSWHKPYRSALLHFESRSWADTVHDYYADGTFKIKGQVINSTSALPGIYDCVPDDDVWSIGLLDIPESATEKDVINSLDFCKEWLIHIELSEASYEEDEKTCYAMIQSLFTSVGPLEWWEIVRHTLGKDIKAVARFHNEMDAREAARTLNDITLPFDRTSKLTVHLVHSAQFKVSALIYKAIESQIKANVKDWKKLKLRFVAYGNSDPNLWYRMLKVEGIDEKSVSNATKTIAAILAGRIAKDGSTTLWHPSLRTTGVLTRRLKGLQDQTGVIIIRNKTKSQIRLYGPPGKCGDVQAKIAKILKTEGSDEFSIELDDETFLWACRGGFRVITDMIGPENARLDVISTPKRIVTTGDLEYQIAASIVYAHRNSRARKAGPSNNNNNATTQDDCSVCWTEAENPIRTSCGHVYCLDCFENLCMSATRQDTPVRICCAGDGSTCSTILGLPELQAHLSSTAFEELLEQSFASYVRQHPQQLRYCPSADCDAVYRAAPDAAADADPAPNREHTCPRCLATVCTACHEQHDRALSCAEHRDRATGRWAAFLRFKKEVGIKDCPRCGTPIEKTDGCDHVLCRCGAHVCWVCLADFDISPECYVHLKDVHGGIGLEYLLGEDDDDDDEEEEEEEEEEDLIELF